MKHEVIAIGAIGDKTRALGKNGDLIWKIPDDLARFKKVTSGHPIIMGSRTYDSLPKRPLPNRTNIVLTRSRNKFDSGTSLFFVNSPEEALIVAKKSEGSEKIFIIGGGEVYKIMLPYTDTLNLTVIEEVARTNADTFFPQYETEFVHIVKDEQKKYNEITYNFKTIRRNGNENHTCRI